MGAFSHVVRVYLLDDQEILRKGLRELVSLQPDMLIVGESGSARSAARSIPEIRPDVVLLDLNLQDGSGIHVCRGARSTDPSIRGVLLTAAGDDEAMIATLLAGAAVFVPKLARGDAVVEAIRRAAAGRPQLDARAVETASARLLALLDGHVPAFDDTERAAVEMLLRGRTDTEITAETRVSPARVADLITTLRELATQPPTGGYDSRPF